MIFDEDALRVGNPSVNEISGDIDSKHFSPQIG